MSLHTGGPAFPLTREMVYSKQTVKETQGMTLRDYFAASALQGILAHPNGIAGLWGLAAEHAYKAADAMLAERKKGESE